MLMLVDLGTVDVPRRDRRHEECADIESGEAREWSHGIKSFEVWKNSLIV